MERLSAMGLNHEQIDNLMQKRLEENSHRHAKHHDSHTGIMEQINHSRLPVAALSQSLSNP